MRHSGLCQQHVHLARHAASNGVHAKLQVDLVVAQQARNLTHSSLGTRHRHAVAWHNKHLLSVGEHLRDGSHIGLRVLLGSAVGPFGSGSSVDAAEEHVEDVAVHGVAHDLGEDRAAEADQRAHNGESGALEQEALSNECPAGIGVQHRDAHRHVPAADTRDEVETHEARQHAHDEQQLHAELAVSRHQEVGRQCNEEKQAEEVQVVLLGQVQGLGLEVPIEFAKGNDAASERDPSDEVAEHRRDVLHGGTGGRHRPERSDGCGHGRETHKRVEGGHGLRKRNGTDLAAHDDAQHATDCEKHGSTYQLLCVERHDAGQESTSYPEHAELAARIGCGHGRQPSNSCDTEERGHRAYRLEELWPSECHQQKDHARHEHQRCEVLLAWLLEQVQHALRHDKPTKDVDRRDGNGHHGQDPGGQHARALHEQDASNSSHAGDGIGHGHERCVQGVRHSPDGLVARCSGKQEGREERR
mmetsp:Transcript_81032/g.188261  ORF Transcript_81032/g.188261 Transcript_81032/m.188261 type:complete len:472 (-) Transcript_81032:95-1510(-)